MLLYSRPLQISALPTVSAENAGRGFKGISHPDQPSRLLAGGVVCWGRDDYNQTNVACSDGAEYEPIGFLEVSAGWQHTSARTGI